MGESKKSARERSRSRSRRKSDAKASEKKPGKKPTEPKGGASKAKSPGGKEAKTTKEAKGEKRRQDSEGARGKGGDAKKAAEKRPSSTPKAEKKKEKGEEKPAAKVREKSERAAEERPPPEETSGASPGAARAEPGLDGASADVLDGGGGAAAESAAPGAVGEAPRRRGGDGDGSDDDAASARGSGGDDSSYSDSSARRRRRRQARGAGFSAMAGPAPPAPPAPGAAMAYGPLAPLPTRVQGLLETSGDLAQEVARMKQAMQAKPSAAARERAEREEEEKETVLRMPPRLHESLLHPENLPKLLARTQLAAATLNAEGLVVLRAHSGKALQKALGQLRRVAYHCQWGCSLSKVAALLADRPAKPAHTVVVRLAAASSRLPSSEARLTQRTNKMRIGTQPGACQVLLEGIPGVSRRHCTITFEADKGACYVQDLSTNGTYLNGKRLPRPPYKNPQDARVRVFHGDELFFRLRTEDVEELGYVINLLELS